MPTGALFSGEEPRHKMRGGPRRSKVKPMALPSSKAPSKPAKPSKAKAPRPVPPNLTLGPALAAAAARSTPRTKRSSVALQQPLVGAVSHPPAAAVPASATATLPTIGEGFPLPATTSTALPAELGLGLPAVAEASISQISQPSTTKPAAPPLADSLSMRMAARRLDRQRLRQPETSRPHGTRPEHSRYNPKLEAELRAMKEERERRAQWCAAGPLESRGSVCDVAEHVCPVLLAPIRLFEQLDQLSNNNRSGDQSAASRPAPQSTALVVRRPMAIVPTTPPLIGQPQSTALVAAGKRSAALSTASNPSQASTLDPSSNPGSNPSSNHGPTLA